MGTAPSARGSVATLARELREDLSAYGSWSRPGFHAVAAHRIGVWRRGLPQPARAAATLLYYALQLVNRHVHRIGLTSGAQVGRRLVIADPGNVTIHPNTVIGDDCLIRHNVSIGIAGEGQQGAPVLGDRVEIGPGAVLIGPITIGDGVRIGPNAVVLRNIPPGAMVVATPGRIIG